MDLLKEGGLFKIVERNGLVTLKNRGEHQTYFVVGMISRYVEKLTDECT